MSWGVTVPSTLAGLVTTFRAASPSTTVLKLAVVGNSSRMEVLTVGAGSELGAAVESHITDGDVGLRSQMETYTVNCLIKVASGSTTPEIIDTLIDRASALLGAVGGALTADQTVGGVVMRARIGQNSWTFEQTKQGALVQIAFGVDVEASTTR